MKTIGGIASIIIGILILMYGAMSNKSGDGPGMLMSVGLILIIIGIILIVF